MSLIEELLSDENLNKAIKRVKANKGASGVDKMKTEELRFYFYNNERFQEKLKGMTPNQFGNHANPNLLPLIV